MDEELKSAADRRTHSSDEFSTASRPDAPHTTPHDLNTLRAHTERGTRGSLFRIGRALDFFTAFLHRRPVTTLVTSALILMLFFLIVDRWW